MQYIEQAASKIDVQAVEANWKKLSDRLSDELARGYSLGRITTESGLTRIRSVRYEDSYKYAVERLRRWCESADKLRSDSPYFDKDCIATEIENKLSAWFDQLDAERAAAKIVTPPLVKTAVSEKVWGGFEQARELCEMVEIDAPPGTGKTCATEQYLAQCRKLEGFTCPVWRITLSEFSASLKSVLQLVAEEMNPNHAREHYSSDSDIVRWIEQYTEGRDGLLIVDEAQHIGDSNKLHGVNILNGLRHFVDRKLFGVAFLSNGEVYRRVAGGKHKQLSSRMEAWRVTIKGVPDEDVDAIMAAYGVSGKSARALCIKKASGAGGLRALVNAFRHAQRKFGEVNHQTLTLLERL